MTGPGNPSVRGAAWPLPRGLLILVGLGSAVLVVTGIKAASSLVGPAFLALVLTIAVHPLRGILARHGRPVWVGTLVAIVSVYAILVAIVFGLLYAVARLGSLLPRYREDFNDLVQSASAGLQEVGVGAAEIESIADAFDLGQLVDAVGSLLGGLLSITSDLFFIVTLLLFLAIDAGSFPQKLAQLTGSRPAVVEAVQSFARGTCRYLVVSTVFGFIVAVVDATFLWMTPIPAPVLWGLLAFITNYIPNIGFVVGLVPPAVLGLLEGGVGLMALVVVVYSVVNFVIQSIVQPKYVGDAVGLSASVTFLSLVFWAWVLGPLGALLAVPLSLLAKALLVDVDQDAGWLRPLLSGESPTPEVRVAAPSVTVEEPVLPEVGDGARPTPGAL